MYDSYANQRQALDQIRQGVQSGAIQQQAPQGTTTTLPNPSNTPAYQYIGGGAGGYFDASGNYRTGFSNNPVLQQARKDMAARQAAMRAAGGFNGSAPQAPYTPNQPGDPFLAFGTGNQPGGVMNNLPTTINNTQNQYGAGYTGFGGSNLTASGGPVYNNNQGGGGQGGQGSSGPSNPTNVPGYYAGMPQTNTRPTVIQGYTPTNPYPGAIAPPLMPNLNRETRTTTAPVAPVYRG